ncbi:hypothetical protein QUW40_01050 [Collinsella tanakaei]|nr:hypothetical protein [Collinsella tanakaei]MDM8245194.1 hypothetical protein [Collinsella tanakaei]
MARNEAENPTEQEVEDAEKKDLVGARGGAAVPGDASGRSVG